MLRKIIIGFFILGLLGCKDNDESSETLELQTYYVNIQASEGGTVNFQNGYYGIGVTQTVTAKPSDNYVFVNWSNGETSETISFIVNSDINLTANFALYFFT